MTRAFRRASAWQVAAGLIALLTVSGIQGIAGQTTQTGTAGLRGVVLDASTGVPLEGAAVSLELEPGGMVAAGGSGRGRLVTARRVSTGSDGAYAFEGLPPGRYRLRVVRIGYRSASFDIHYDGPADPRVSVGLEVEPVQLEPVAVVATRPATTVHRQGRSIEPQDDRIQTERLRQQRYLSSDTRELRRADIAESVTLGETDLLRALHRLPGVTAEDDWSAEPWVRGARWDETRVYFDGMPLLDPMHLGGVFTSVSPDAVGALTFHPGVRPVGSSAASGSLVDLRSRPATGDGPLTVLGQISLLSGRLSVDKPLGGGSGVTISGRRSYVHELAQDENDPIQDAFPYRFSDISGRWDQALGDSLSLEVSGLRTVNRIMGDIPHELKGTRARWSNAAGRVALESRYGGIRARLNHGKTTFDSRVELTYFDPDRADLINAPTAAETSNRILFDVTEVTVGPLAENGTPGPWGLGIRRTGTRVNYDGPAPWPFPQAATAGRLEESSTVGRFSYWGQLRTSLSESVEVEVGLGVEAPGLEPDVGPDLAATPRVSATWSPDADTRISFGLGRHYQYEQALATTGFLFGPALGPGHLWVSARGGIPAIRADLATLGAERWLPGGWLATATVYGRHSRGQLTPSPDSGYVRARPAIERATVGDGWVNGTSTAYGLEVGARKLEGRWTGSASYSVARSRTDAEGTEFTALGSRAHALDASLVFNLTRQTQIAAAFTAESGAAYTRFYTFRCTEISWYCSDPQFGDPPVVGFKEPAAGERTPTYASLDLHLEKTGHIGALPFGLYIQLRNALGRENHMTYIGSILTCAGNDGVTDCSIRDRFEDGFPTVPLVGFWIRW